MLRLLDVVPGRVVLDPFMGSGSTGVACAKAGRQFIGIELDPEHFSTSCSRVRDAVAQRQAMLPMDELAKEEQGGLL